MGMEQHLTDAIVSCRSYDILDGVFVIQDARGI